MVIDDFQNGLLAGSERSRIPLERLERSRQEVEGSTDGLNRTIDEGIREGVAVFRSFGVETTQSCEGHLSRGSPSPYIDIRAADEPEYRFAGEKEELERLAQVHDITPPEITAWPIDKDRAARAEAAYNERRRWQNNPDSKYLPEYEAWEQKDARTRATTIKLLDCFYAARPTPPEERLVFEKGRLRINSPLYEQYIEAADTQTELPDSFRTNLVQLLPRYQAEMNAFIDFLKEAYFEKSE